MSTSRHPIALSIERRVGGATRLLATVMALPLVDGIFPALVLAGALGTPLGIVQIGLLVFGGSATVAVILAEMDGTPREQASAVALVGVGIVALAAVEAALAPTIESVLVMATFERFAALVILAVAAKTASARVGEFLPRPAVIVGLGLVASLDLSGAQVELILEPGLIARAAAAAGVGAVFALLVALLAPTLRDLVDIDRFRFGSAVALGTLPLSLMGFIYGPAPLAVLCVTAVFALDPSGVAKARREHAESAQDTPSGEPVGDGGTVDDDPRESVDEPADSGGSDYNEDGTPRDDGRAPWL